MTKVENKVQSTALAKQEVSNRELIQTVEITEASKMPDLSKMGVVPIDLMADYWTPENPGEVKRVIFDRIDVRQVKDINSDELIDLECAFFLEQVDGEIRSVSNGSKRLVGAIQNMNMQRGSALEITYKGKKKNKGNNFQSDNWGIRPLIINIDKK